MCGEDCDLLGSGFPRHGCRGGPGWPNLVNPSAARTVNNVLSDFSAQGLEVVLCVRACISRHHMGWESRLEGSLGGRLDSPGAHRLERGEAIGSPTRFSELDMAHGALGGPPRPHKKAHDGV